MKRTKARRFAALLLCFAAVFLFSMPSYADIGPKRSVEITFTGTEEEPYYATLLSQEPSTGPHSVWDGHSAAPDRYDETEQEIWHRFTEYKDADGFYFLQQFWECSKTDSMHWGYYPPETFKILVYFPRQDVFLTSPVYTQYAFDSYFTADLSAASQGVFTARKSYDYTWEIISLLCRIVLTILLEIGAALCFGYRQKKQLLLILWVNAATQIALNLALNVINFKNGPWVFTFWFALLELAVFAVEAILYAAFLVPPESRKTGKKRAVIYAFAANAFSFVAGFAIARYIPGIF